MKQDGFDYEPPVRDGESGSGGGIAVESASGSIEDPKYHEALFGDGVTEGCLQTVAARLAPDQYGESQEERERSDKAWRDTRARVAADDRVVDAEGTWIGCMDTQGIPTNGLENESTRQRELAFSDEPSARSELERIESARLVCDKAYYATYWKVWAEYVESTPE